MKSTKKTWLIRARNSILGWRVVGARPLGRATVRPAPPHVLSFMLAGKDGILEPAALESVESALAKGGTGEGFTVKQRGPLERLVRAEIDDPRPHPRKPYLPKNVKRAVRSLADLCRFFSAETPDQLNRRIYKGTACGAWISVETPDGKWHHCGSDWSDVREITAFMVGTIVEGSDAEVRSDPFVLPVRWSEIENWCADMEAQADDIWHEANDEIPEVAASGSGK